MIGALRGGLWGFFLIAILLNNVNGQSLEVMPGMEQLFVDVQWLKPLREDYSVSLFSRTRATVAAENKTDIFTAAYLNYTTKAGIGASLVGRVASRGADADAGVHYFRSTPSITFFGLASVALTDEFSIAWFSIFRFTPALHEHWKLFSSVELYSLFNSRGHLFSVQRLRLGVGRNSYQFGLALNLSASGGDYENPFANPGIFLRKSFD